jgi:hypothetical protein
MSTAIFHLPFTSRDRGAWGNFLWRKRPLMTRFGNLCIILSQVKFSLLPVLLLRAGLFRRYDRAHSSLARELLFPEVITWT